MALAHDRLGLGFCEWDALVLGADIEPDIG